MLRYLYRICCIIALYNWTAIQKFKCLYALGKDIPLFQEWVKNDCNCKEANCDSHQVENGPFDCCRVGMCWLVGKQLWAHQLSVSVVLSSISRFSAHSLPTLESQIHGVCGVSRTSYCGPAEIMVLPRLDSTVSEKLRICPKMYLFYLNWFMTFSILTSSDPN